MDHWLTAAAARGGVGDASASGLPHDEPTVDAWKWICGFLKCTPAELAGAVAKAFRLEIADLDRVDPGALELVPRKLARTLGVLPLHAGDREITVATSEPIDYDAERQIGFVTSRRVHFQVADPEGLTHAIQHAYSERESRGPIGSADLDAAFDRVQPDHAAIARAPATARDAATVKICRLIIYEAVRAEATEIHMSLGPSTGRVQFKVDGKLTTFLRVPIETLRNATSRIRGMADAEGDENHVVRRVLNVRIDRQPYDVTVQTVPGYPHNLVMGLMSESPELDTTTSRPDEAPTAPTWERRTDENEGHILVVDDDEGGRLLMRTILERNGFRVSEADDGSTALPFLEHAEDVDGILLDLMMKTVDGMEVLKKVRKSRKLAALPVVILTASPDPEDERRLLRAGADDYLKKPIDHHQLVQRIQAVMRRAQSR
jgi:CheY-like chemotaxis protein